MWTDCGWLRYTYLWALDMTGHGPTKWSLASWIRSNWRMLSKESKDGEIPPCMPGDRNTSSDVITTPLIHWHVWFLGDSNVGPGFDCYMDHLPWMLIAFVRWTVKKDLLIFHLQAQEQAGQVQREPQSSRSSDPTITKTAMTTRHHSRNDSWIACQDANNLVLNDCCYLGCKETIKYCNLW